jgi:hypothetical protein
MIYCKSDFSIRKVSETEVYIVDLDNGAMSVTNDAENVVAYLYERFGNKKFYYRDTMGNTDELLHDHGAFTGFRIIG